jgi:hypothetical protein
METKDEKMNSQRQPTSISDDLESKAKSEAAEVVTEKLTPRQKKVADEITKWFAFGGVALVNSDAYDAMLLIKTSAQHAELIVKAARHDKRVFEVLERMTQSSDIIALATFEGILLYALLVHHGRVPENKPLLQQFGYSEEQVLAPPPTDESAENGYVSNAASANIPV